MNCKSGCTCVFANLFYQANLQQTENPYQVSFCKTDGKRTVIDAAIGGMYNDHDGQQPRKSEAWIGVELNQTRCDWGDKHLMQRNHIYTLLLFTYPKTSPGDNVTSQSEKKRKKDIARQS